MNLLQYSNYFGGNMTALIQFLLFGHTHRWVETDRVPLVESRNSIPFGKVVYCTCSICGKPTRFKLV